MNRSADTTQKKPARKIGGPAAWLGLAALLAAVDLAVKALAEARLSDGRTIDLGVLNIQLGYNTGVAFSIGSDLPPWVIVLFTGVITVVLAGFVWRQSTQPGPRLSLVGFSAVLGGAVGNFIDRLDGAGVVDYLHTGWFPTFNLADVLITLGVVILAISALINDDSPSPASSKPGNPVEPNPQSDSHPPARKESERE